MTTTEEILVTDGVMSTEQYHRGLDQLARELTWALDEVQETKRQVGEGLDEAYGLRRGGEPFAPASGGTSDPTQSGAFSEQARVTEVRDQLRQLTVAIPRVTEEAKGIKERLRKIRRKLERPPARPGDRGTDVPRTPPLIDPTEGRR